MLLVVLLLLPPPLRLYRRGPADLIDAFLCCHCLCLVGACVNTARVRTTGGAVPVVFCAFTGVLGGGGGNGGSLRPKNVPKLFQTVFQT